MRIIPAAELKFTFIRSPGPGGQNVNKVASAVQLRFNVLNSPSLAEAVKLRLVNILGKKLTQDGDLIIKASRFRTQSRNKEDALNRLNEFVAQARVVPKKRQKTRPSRAAKEKRLTQKKRQGAKKSLRGIPIKGE